MPARVWGFESPLRHHRSIARLAGTHHPGLNSPPERRGQSRCHCSPAAPPGRGLHSGPPSPFPDVRLPLDEGQAPPSPTTRLGPGSSPGPPRPGPAGSRGCAGGCGGSRWRPGRRPRPTPRSGATPSGSRGRCAVEQLVVRRRSEEEGAEEGQEHPRYRVPSYGAMSIPSASRSPRGGTTRLPGVFPCRSRNVTVADSRRPGWCPSRCHSPIAAGVTPPHGVPLPGTPTPALCLALRTLVRYGGRPATTRATGAWGVRGPVPARVWGFAPLRHQLAPGLSLAGRTWLSAPGGPRRAGG